MSIRSFRGELPLLGRGAYVDEAAVLIGRVKLGDDASIWPMVVARGDVNRIEIGARTNIQDGSVLHVVRDGLDAADGIALLIGDDVTVGHQAMLHAVTIGNRCLIGMSSVLLDGSVIDDEVIVGAGSVVPPGKHLVSRGLYLGNPARRVRELTATELERIVLSAAHYVRLKDVYLEDQALLRKASSTS
jgi:carbonic anhydrase/acetyltransferase-like protein (isoleucine patch superfamily)